MASPHPHASPKEELPPQCQTHSVEIVWGAPSDEMLEAETRGEILLVEDLNRVPQTPLETDDFRSSP